MMLDGSASSKSKSKSRFASACCFLMAIMASCLVMAAKKTAPVFPGPFERLDQDRLSSTAGQGAPVPGRLATTTTGAVGDGERGAQHGHHGYAFVLPTRKGLSGLHAL